MERSHGSDRINISRIAALVAAFFLALVALAAHQPAAPSKPAAPALRERSRVMENFARLPLGFEPNRGQAGSGIDFIARGGGFEAFLDPAGATLILGAPPLQTLPSKNKSAHTKPARIELSQIRMSLEGASCTVRAQTEERLPGVVNYYLGNDRSKWHSGVPTYGRVKYANVYRGIDLAYYGDRGSFEFDFDLKPGADANKIALAVNGIDGAEVSSDGTALLKTAKGNLTLKRPVAYQQIDGVRREVQADYKIASMGKASKAARITIALGDYDHSRALTIDPVILFSTFFGGTTTQITGTAIDSSGNVYLTGWAFDCGTCANFPSTTGPAFQGVADAFVTEITSKGALAYATLIGGSMFDEGKAVAADEGQNSYLTGVTFSTDFPVTTGPMTAPGNGDGFVAKFSNTGAVVFSTYLGGSEFDEPFSIALEQGCASDCDPFVAGLTQSSNFPDASGFVGQSDAFVTEMKDDGSGEVFTTLLAGSNSPNGTGTGATFATSIAVDSGGVSFVTGGTDATNFPKSEGQSFGGATDAFVAKLTSGGSVSYARYLGGSDFDQGEGIAIQPGCTEPCDAYVEGITFSSDFPPGSTLTAAAAEFVAELSSDGSTTVYSTLLETTDAPVFGAVNGIAVDTAGDAYVVGSTTSNLFPLNNSVRGFPGPNGALWQFAEGATSPSPTPTPAPQQLTWPEANGSPLTIQQGNTDTFVGSTTGLFLSTDGVHFSQVSATGLPSGAVTALDFETSLTPNVVFAGTGSGLFTSTDLGSTFAPTGFTKSIDAVVDIPGASLSNTDVLVGTVINGAWSSTDGGTSFTQVASLPTTATITSFAGNGSKGSSPGQVFAGTSRGVFTAPNVSSSNFPGTWSLTSLANVAVGAVTTDQNSSPAVDYAGTFFQGLFESNDNFMTFSRANLGQFGYSALELDRDKGTTPATVFVGVNALDQAFVYENVNGFGGEFTETNFSNEPGSVKGLKNPFVGEVLQLHPIIAEINPAGSMLTFSSYFGGSSYDEPAGVAVDPTGTDIYIAGTTYSADFPTAGTPVSTYHGFESGFVAKLGPPASASATATSTASSTPTSTASGSPTATSTASATATSTSSISPTATATATPNGSKLKAPASLKFKPVGIGTSASSTAKLVIENIGKSGELFGSIAMPSDPEFTLSGTTFSVEPRKTQTITITLVPTKTNPSGTIAISSNGGDANVTLSGSGLAGKLSVAKTLTITSTGVGTPGMANLVLKNVGKGLLMGSVSAATAPFSGGGSGGTINPDKSTPVPITYTPTSTSPATSSVTVTADPPSTGSTTVTLKGIVKAKK